MSNDLNFWRNKDETQARGAEDHLGVYDAFGAGQDVSGLKPLPWPGLQKRMDIHFKPWRRDGDVWEKKGVVDEKSGTPRSLRFDLRGAWTGDHANPIADIMITCRCPLYDPQAAPDGVRFALEA